jgi:hypothetical protein
MCVITNGLEETTANPRVHSVQNWSVCRGSGAHQSDQAQHCYTAVPNFSRPGQATLETGNKTGRRRVLLAIIQKEFVLKRERS